MAETKRAADSPVHNSSQGEASANRIGRTEAFRSWGRALFLPLTFLFLIAGLGAWQTRHLLNSMNWVAHTEKVIVEVGAVQKDVLDMESGLRGYLLTGDAVFLDPYVTAKKSLATGLQSLAHLIEDNSRQTDRLRSLENQMIRWQSYSEGRIDQEQSPLRGPVKNFLSAELKSKRMMDAIRAQIDTIRAEEMRLMQLRTHEYERNETTLLILLFGMGIFAVGVTAVTSKRRREHEVDVFESNERFSLLANSIPQLAWMADPSGHLFWYNQRWYDYTGTTFEDMEGWGWEKVHNPELLPRVLDKWKKAISAGVPWDDTFQLKGKDGVYRWFLSRANPILNANGEVVRWFGSNTDITEQLKTQDELRAAVQTRDTFLSIASHELKTPLTSLKLQTQIMHKMIDRAGARAMTPEKGVRLVESTEKQVSRLIRLVENMLDITRIKTGGITLEPEQFEFCDLIHEVIERLSPHFQEAGCQLNVVTCERGVGSWDRSRMEQVITNLLTNALRYGRGKPVEMAVYCDGKKMRIRVSDQGIGVATENLERIFGRFERAVSADETSGLGLGLYISRQIVEVHGGRIWVDSELGKGSSFWVELPLQFEYNRMQMRQA